MTEIIPIVDKNDQVIGSVAKDKFDKTTGAIYRTVSLFLFNKKGQILIQRRAFSKKTYAGKWDFAAVAGHVAFGESYLEAIQRETDEELGLKNIDFFEVEKNLQKLKMVNDVLHRFFGLLAISLSTICKCQNLRLRKLS